MTKDVMRRLIRECFDRDRAEAAIIEVICENLDYEAIAESIVEVWAEELHEAAVEIIAEELLPF